MAQIRKHQKRQKLESRVHSKEGFTYQDCNYTVWRLILFIAYTVVLLTDLVHELEPGCRELRQLVRSKFQYTPRFVVTNYVVH